MERCKRFPTDTKKCYLQKKCWYKLKFESLAIISIVCGSKSHNRDELAISNCFKYL